MTPKKDIVRKPTLTLPDGSPIPSMGKEFTPKESRFIFWYTSPGTEAFLNAGRAAIRAGYRPKNAVTQAYLLKQKPRIAGKIDDILNPVKFHLHETLFRVIHLCRIRMFFDIKDFYRPCKRIIKTHGVEQEIDSFKAIPLDEISEGNRMCIDGVDIKTICGKDEIWYKLPDRDVAFEQFFRCYKILFPEKEDDGEIDWKNAAAFLREGVMSPVIAHRDGKPPMDAIEAR
jgi:hypothetical protein